MNGTAKLAKIYKLANVIQDYAWGSKHALKELFNIENPLGKPQAEVWMGAHPKAPSSVVISDSEQVLLTDFIAWDPDFVLGPEVNKAFNGQLPFLFKVLSAGAPLSIQAHPDKKQAVEGFERENREGIDLGAPHRNYKDGNHKPELIYAVTPFKALRGFREMSEILRLLDKLNLPVMTDALKEFKADPSQAGLRGFYTWLMKLEGREKDDLIDQAVLAAEEIDEDPAFEELLSLHSYYSGDIGIMGAVLLNLVVLEPGEAMYLDAGELHAYLHGTGMEIMANSDNVLRGGLTPKHVDVNQLLKTLTFNSAPVTLTDPTQQEYPGETVFTTPAREFQLHVVRVEGNEYLSPRDRAVEILFCAAGAARISVTGTGDFIDISAGESCLVPAGLPQYAIQGTVTLYKATVP